MKPLEGIKILDFTHAYSAVYTAMQFADLGADVIKIERIGGEQSREWMPFSKEYESRSTYYSTFNRNRVNLALNTKFAEGKEIIYQLAKDADIILVNMRNGAMDGLGLGYEDIKKINPKIIYGTLNGYGSKGPLSPFKAYDNICSAYSGIMYATGREDQDPMKLGISIGDNYAGLNLFSSVMTALVHQQLTGEGQLVEIAMQDSLFGLLDRQILEYSMTGEEPKRGGNAHTQFAPEDVFVTIGDDNHVALSVQSDSVWQTFCMAMNKPEWAADEKFATNALRKENYAVLRPLIADVFAKMDKFELQEKLMKVGVPCAAALKVNEIISDPQFIERHMVRYQNDIQVGPLLTAGIPMKFSDTPAEEIQSSRFPGQDNVKILKERLGYTDEKIQELIDKKVI